MAMNNRYEHEDYEMKKFFDKSSFKPQEAKSMCDRLQNFADGTKYFIQKGQREAQNEHDLIMIHNLAEKNIKLLHGQHKDLTELVCNESRDVACIMLENCGNDFTIEMNKLLWVDL